MSVFRDMYFEHDEDFWRKDMLDGEFCFSVI